MKRRRTHPDLLTPPELREVETRRAAYIRAQHGQKTKRWLALRDAKHRGAEGQGMTMSVSGNAIAEMAVKCAIGPLPARRGEP